MDFIASVDASFLMRVIVRFSFARDHCVKPKGRVAVVSSNGAPLHFVDLLVYRCYINLVEMIIGYQVDAKMLKA